MSLRPEQDQAMTEAQGSIAEYVLAEGTDSDWPSPQPACSQDSEKTKEHEKKLIPPLLLLPSTARDTSTGAWKVGVIPHGPLVRADSSLQQ